MTAPAPLRLMAQDEGDLAVLSAALQDAVLKLGDIAYDPRARSLTLQLNRYRWEGKGGERVRCGVQFASVLGVQSRKLKRGAPDAVVSLLSVGFEAGEAPGGAVVLAFAGGADLRLQVECVEAVLLDVSTPWPTNRRPGHEGEKDG